MKTLLLSLFLAHAASAAGPRSTLGVPAPWTLHDAAGVRIAVHDPNPSASGTPVVCLHAVGHGGGDYAGLVQRLGDRRLIVVDWPDHGHSGEDPEGASAARYAEVLEALLEELDLGPVVLVGNSVGGAAAIRVAHARPERVRGLVLVAPGGLDPGGWLARWFIGTRVRWYERGAVGDPRFPGWYAGQVRGILPAEAARPRQEAIAAAGASMAGPLAEAWASFARPEADLRDRLPELRLPVLVAWAREDRTIRWSRNRVAVATLPRAEVVFFDGGHVPFLEDPDAFADTLRHWLEALEGGQL